MFVVVFLMPLLITMQLFVDRLFFVLVTITLLSLVVVIVTIDMM
jgi:hypothetical protein